MKRYFVSLREYNSLRKTYHRQDSFYRYTLAILEHCASLGHSATLVFFVEKQQKMYKHNINSICLVCMRMCANFRVHSS